MRRVIVEVEGGVVQWVHSDAAIQVDVLDHDNGEAETDPNKVKEFKRLARAVDKMRIVFPRATRASTTGKRR